MAVYLKSLDLQGFKSFGTKTHIEFSDGITGIVGPNGCGKSNVIEAMKWVLGEQSAKSLRGDKMQDIIFAGTKHRSASGMAEVSLTLNNELNWLPLDYPEVSIGRRVFRSGEGQYFVNGVRSRLKDTVELFLDTGVGRDSYAIFEQGKIDRLLSESAEERRILFEDFAGISKFKFRKEEAEKKLQQARDNLDRLQETLSRLEKEIASLELQAQDADAYNHLNAALRETEVKFEVARVLNMRKEIERRERDAAALKDALQPLSEALNDLETQMSLSDEALGEKERLFGQMNEKHIRLEKELTEAKTRYDSAGRNLKDTRNRLIELDLRARQDLDRLEEWEDTLADKRDAVSDAEKKQAKAKELLLQAESVEQELKNKTNHAEQALLQASQAAGFKKAVTRDDIDALRKEIAEIHGRLFVFESDIIRFDDIQKNKASTLNREEEEFLKLEKALNNANTESKLFSERKKNARQETELLEKTIQELQKQYKSAQVEAKNCDVKILSAIDAQMNALKRFRLDEPHLIEELNAYLSKTEQSISTGKGMTMEDFLELKSILAANKQAYDYLLSAFFGEGSAFTEKLSLTEELEKLFDQLDREKEKYDKQRKFLSEIEREENERIRMRAQLESEYKAIERDLKKTKTDFEQARFQGEQTHRELESARKILQAKEKLSEEIEAIITDYDKQHHRLRQEHGRHQEELAQARIGFGSAEAQAKALQSDIRSLEQRLEDVRRSIGTYENDKKNLSRTIAELEEEMEDLLAEQDDLAPELSRLRDAMGRNADEINDLKRSKKALELTHKDNVEKFTKLRIRESELEGSLAERRETLEAMRQSLREQFKIGENDISLEESDTIDHLNKTIREYRNRLNQMGGVNLLAIEQFQAAKDQYTELLRQKTDIETAADDTESLIKETNRESAERFNKAFEEIRRSFKDLFSELFDGGRADLILKDKNDPLNSGIDIMAEPPGQKFQSVSLLSGGQRAMVAIAVIFSILKLKPTPFVILDEMDAPLDDENIERFKKLLVRFKGTSQFVIVSHSKSTLEACDVLFAVTMEELGCSKVLSVAFDETEQLLFAE